MAVSELRFIKRCAEFVPMEELKTVPPGTRGIYVLLKKKSGAPKRRLEKYEVVYIGMARGRKAGVRSRLRSHKRRKLDLWTHFSLFEVWDNITEAEVAELEGLFRHIYRRDPQANRVNLQRSFKKFRNVREDDLSKWLQ